MMVEIRQPSLDSRQRLPTIGAQGTLLRKEIDELPYSQDLAEASRVRERACMATTTLSQVGIDSCVGDIGHTEAVFNKPNAKPMSCAKVHPNCLAPIPLGLEDRDALGQIWTHRALLQPPPHF